MKNIFLFLIILFISVCSLFAVPAVPWAVEKTQPDGTKISVFLKGDESLHWMESADGYTLMYDSLKYVVYAQTDVQGNLTPSNIKFESNTKPGVNITKGLRYSKAQINTLMQIKKMTKNAGIQRAATGNVKVLCILAGFSNRAFTKTKAEFEALMNQVGYSAGGAQGSVRDFYLESSYGALNLQVTVVGPVTLPQSTSYYAPKTRWRDFANEVVDLADPLVDFSKFATNGQVEGFHIIFAGYGNEAIGNGQQIWSHKGVLRLIGNVRKDGVKLSQYSCSPELRGSTGSNITHIGVIAHELGHVFGSPDYYDVSSNTNSKIDFIGSGYWDLMASGSWNNSGRQPAHINPYQKIQFGWITPKTLTAGNEINNMPPVANNPVVYKIRANTNGEHYLLENRQQVGFDASLFGHGLLIWHIAANVADYAPNENHPLQVYPVCASSTTAVPTNDPNSYGEINSTGCTFPGTSGKTEFTDVSTPRAFTWTNSAGIKERIINITENANQTVSFEISCPPVNFNDRIITTNTDLRGCEINVQNVSVQNGAKLILAASNSVDITNNFEVELGSELYISGYEQCSTCPIIVESWPTLACKGKAFQFNVENANRYSIQVYSMTGSLVYSGSEIMTIGNSVTVWNVPRGTATGYYNVQVTFFSGSGYYTESESYTILIIGC